MIKFLTIQKAAHDMGVDITYIRKMIKNKDLTPHRKEGYKRIYINIDELNASIKPIDGNLLDIDLDKYLV